MISRDESKNIIYQLKTDDLADTGWALKDMLSAAGPKSSEPWKKTIGLWFLYAWPKMPIKRSSQLSTNLAIESNEAFPDVVTAVIDCLTGVEYSHALYDLKEAETEVQLVRRFPSESLTLLGKLVQENTHADQELLSFLLETIREADPLQRLAR